MSNTIVGQTYTNSQLFGGGKSTQPITGQVPETSPVIADAEAVAKVANTVVKPSEVSKAAQPLNKTIEEAAQDLQKYMQSSGRNLSFSVDQNTGYQIVRVMNADTGELIRQMPSPEFLKLAESMPQTNSGLVNQKA
jgi:flagellar protein FlaG